MSCKTSKEIGNSDSIIGTAINEKYGAILHANGAIYAIAGLQSWDIIYLEKRVKIQGHFKLMIDKDKSDIKNFGTFQAQSYPNYYLVEDAMWELYDSN